MSEVLKGLDKFQAEKGGITWKFYVMGAVLALGIFGMSSYKIEAIPGERWTFIFLVIFVEVAAGLAVMAQALLRKKDEAAGEIAYKFSIFFRLMLALIGIVIYREANGDPVLWWLDSVDEGVRVDRMSLAGLLTYEVSNGLMLMMEWVFSKLVGGRDFDYEKMARDVWDECKLMLKSKDEEVEEVRELLKNNEVEMKGIREGKKDMQEQIEDSRGCVEELLRVLEGKWKRGEKPMSQLGDDWKIVERFLKEVENKKKRDESVMNLVGMPLTVRKNIKGWVCGKCFSYGEVNHKNECRCQECGEVTK